MATHRIPAAIVRPHAEVPIDLLANQLSLTNTDVGNILCYVLNAGGTVDRGVWVAFNVPKNYVGTPKLVAKGVLDGALSATTLQLTFKKIARADAETVDAAWDAEQTASIGSGTDEHLRVISITLTAGDYVADDEVFGYLAVDDSATTYAGNFLLLADEGVFFEYADA